MKTVTFTIVARNPRGDVALATARSFVDEPPIIEAVIVDPPLVRAGGAARLTVIARDPENAVLTFTVAASDGTIEATVDPTVFVWRAPGGSRRRESLEEIHSPP